MIRRGSQCGWMLMAEHGILDARQPITASAGNKNKTNFDNIGQHRTDETMAQTAQIAIEIRVIIVLGVVFTVDVGIVANLMGSIGMTIQYDILNTVVAMLSNDQK